MRLWAVLSTSAHALNFKREYNKYYYKKNMYRSMKQDIMGMAGRRRKNLERARKPQAVVFKFGKPYPY